MNARARTHTHTHTHTRTHTYTHTHTHTHTPRHLTARVQSPMPCLVMAGSDRISGRDGDTCYSAITAARDCSADGRGTLTAPIEGGDLAA